MFTHDIYLPPHNGTTLWVLNVRIFVPTVAQIGFVDTSYIATERDGVVVVSVALLNGSLTDNVVVRLETADGSATGELTIIVVVKLLLKSYSCKFTVYSLFLKFYYKQYVNLSLCYRYQTLKTIGVLYKSSHSLPPPLKLMCPFRSLMIMCRRVLRTSCQLLHWSLLVLQ